MRESPTPFINVSKLYTITMGMILLKKRIGVISVLMAGMLTLSAGAAEITNVIVSDFDNSVITVSGDADEAMVSVTMLPEDTTLAEGEYLTTDNISIQKADVSEGKFTASFKFGGTSGVYDFYVSGNSDPYKLEFINKAEVLEFVEDLGDNLYSGTDLAAKFKYFAPAMGIDLAFATSDAAMTCVTEAIEAGSELIKDGGITAITEIVNQTKAELELLAAIAGSESATVVNNLLTEYSESAKVDITLYSSLTDYGKTYVCQGLVGKSYAKIAQLRTDLAKAVANAPASEPTEDSDDDNSSGSSGSSNRGGGGGGGGASVVIPVTPAVPEPEVEDGTVIFERFNDIDGVNWAWEAILYLSDRNIINGTGEGSFLPNDSITREQFAKIIAEAFDCVDDTASSAFGDVAHDDWADKYIASVASKGYMNGIDLGSFGYGQNITRQDICVTIYRAAKLMGYKFNTQKNDFADFDSVSDYAKEAVSCLAGEGIINGTGDGTFKPQNSATRAEAAKIIYSVMTKMGK